MITQNDKPLAFYSRKLNATQCRYTTTECELLSIVETLKEFKNSPRAENNGVYGT
ncbi:MAG: RNase H-like domain-containing protein [Gloeomargaritales cyanobacterium]